MHIKHFGLVFFFLCICLDVGLFVLSAKQKSLWTVLCACLALFKDDTFKGFHSTNHVPVVINVVFMKMCQNSVCACVYGVYVLLN